MSWHSIEILPDPVAATAPATVFSAERAFTHVKTLAKQPRVLGTPANAVARDYLAAQMSRLGCAPTLQQTTAATHWGQFVYTGKVANLYCVLPGARPEAILLMSHYDSVHNSFGAGDSAVGASIVLETARALLAQGLQNTVVLLFTDGEENGLKGASAFVREGLPKN